MYTENLIVKEKTGFMSFSDYVLIYKGAKPHYYKRRENTKNGIIEFNMPPGNFYVLNGVTSKLKDPVVYNYTVKYKKDFPFAAIPEFEVKFGNNPNKCTIDLFAKPKPTAFFDRSLEGRPDYEFLYVGGHEYAHNVFRGHGQESEEACDSMAFSSMLVYGLNPCQCVAAVDGVLGNYPLSCIRKTKAYEDMKALD